MVSYHKKKIGIFIIAYNAEFTLASVIDRIPKEVKRKVAEIFVFDDHSKDQTYQQGLSYKKHHRIEKLNIYRNEKNLGYGGNQKRGYNYAVAKGYDIVVMVHGDGQYAPEVLPELLKPLENDEADMVFGSRMTQNPLKGGMPLYKYLGNKFLTTIENFLLNTNLSEFHSGCRLYSCKALQQVPFNLCSDKFHFDTDIIIQFLSKELRIAERPIPTFYGNEVSHVKVLSYGYNVLKSVVQYKLHKYGILKVAKFQV